MSGFVDTANIFREVSFVMVAHGRNALQTSGKPRIVSCSPMTDPKVILAEQLSVIVVSKS